MDRDNKEEDGNSESKEGKVVKVEEIQRITVSRQVQEALGEIVERVNDGFSGGKVNRVQAANWIIMRFHESLNDSEIKAIRTEHFDEVAMLESIFRKAKESGKVPSEFKALLQKQLEFSDLPKRKPKKALTENYVNGVINKSEES